MYENLALYIDGKFSPAGNGRSQDVVNPATGKVLAQLPHATRRPRPRARRRRARVPDLAHSSPMEREDAAQGRRARAHPRARTSANITLDQGKPLAEAVGEVQACAEHVDWHAEECRRIYGRVIPPRREACASSCCASRSACAPPSRRGTSRSTRRSARSWRRSAPAARSSSRARRTRRARWSRSRACFHDAGLPAGVLNVVWGVPAEISEYLIKSPIVRKVSFTGSIPVGKQLAALAGAHMKRVTMELGGHSPVHRLRRRRRRARRRRCWPRFKFRNAGQVCVSPTRFYVQEKVYDRFVATLRRHTRKTIKVGGGLEPDTKHGAARARAPRCRRWTSSSTMRSERGGRDRDRRRAHRQPRLLLPADRHHRRAGRQRGS